MLQLQRASAGSGKTYALAKKFIWFLIAVKEPGRPWRLRGKREIADGLGRILAITFTNKATNEMKQRIVAKLADLATAATAEITPDMMRKVAYLKDFSDELGTDPRAIGEACAAALSALLNEYSDFKVSTIDSFFQTILRTFAYESNLNDSYQVEIESGFIAAEAVDATFDNVDNRRKSSSAASIWLEMLIDKAADAGQGWNVFQKNDRRGTIYHNILNSISKLESEEFKAIRTELDTYFKSEENDPLLDVYTKITREFQGITKKTTDNLKSICRRLTALLQRNGVNPATDCQRFADGHLRKIMQLKPGKLDKTITFKPLELTDSKTYLKKGVDCADLDEINSLGAEMYDEYASYLELFQDPLWQHWNVYAPLMPYLGILGECRRMMARYLEQNNLIQLAETNSMLQRIIGDDDAPFIYERLGTRLNHYLIDEFQDTSKMQWRNLRPLIAESESRDQSNLIIGDAKQSIYRFRNADPSIITSVVPGEFPGHSAAGLTREENTNWRSDRTIVEFNNMFFHALVKKIAGLSAGVIDFADLFSNVIQHASHRSLEGYVEIRFADGKSSETGDDGDSQSTSGHEVVELIASLLKRGYRCRDIAILVERNDEGRDMIDEIVAYNGLLTDGQRKIDFISEESLLVSSAEAVKIIISVLRKMTEGSVITGSSDSKDSDGEGQDKKSEEKIYNWNQLKCNFSFFAINHPQLPVEQQIELFLNDAEPEEAVNIMLSKMQTVALPALVEAITENFVPADLRRSQAVFIAGLQDLVLEYCESHNADIASFLSWWEAKGMQRSISSPEGTDAVQIMTIHKSKGLEFKCVIMPNLTHSMEPTGKKTEWRWVRPAAPLRKFHMPPFIPVETTTALLDTEHAHVYHQYHDLYMMDKLNACYVAFTRAVSELYIFSSLPKPGKKKKTGSAAESNLIGHYLLDICTNYRDYTADLAASPLQEDVIDADLVTIDPETQRITIGTPPALATAFSDISENDLSTKTEDLIIEEYGVDSDASVLQYVESSDDSTDTLTPEALDPDPRSEGNLLHSIMATVKTADDLPRAINSLKMRGLISRRQADEWRHMLSEAMASPSAASWFSPGWRVLNERAIIYPGSNDRRPDRVMISKDGTEAIVIDYKFGAEPTGDAYRRQVGEYADLVRETTGIRNVSAFLWYVRSGKIERVV